MGFELTTSQKIIRNKVGLLELGKRRSWVFSTAVRNSPTTLSRPIRRDRTIPTSSMLSTDGS